MLSHIVNPWNVLKLLVISVLIAFLFSSANAANSAVSRRLANEIEEDPELAAFEAATRPIEKPQPPKEAEPTKAKGTKEVRGEIAQNDQPNEIRTEAPYAMLARNGREKNIKTQAPYAMLGQSNKAKETTQQEEPSAMLQGSHMQVEVVEAESTQGPELFNNTANVNQNVLKKFVTRTNTGSYGGNKDLILRSPYLPTYRAYYPRRQNRFNARYRRYQVFKRKYRPSGYSTFKAAGAF